jgi:hypothetical protein
MNTLQNIEQTDLKKQVKEEANGLVQWLPICSTRTPGGTLRTCWGTRK